MRCYPPTPAQVFADPRLRDEEGCALGLHFDDELPLGAGLCAKTKETKEETPQQQADGRANG